MVTLVTIYLIADQTRTFHSYYKQQGES